MDLSSLNAQWVLPIQLQPQYLKLSISAKMKEKKYDSFFFLFFFETFSMVQKICRKNSNDATVLKSQLFLSGRLKKFREINALFLKIDNSVNWFDEIFSLWKYFLLFSTLWMPTMQLHKISTAAYQLNLWSFGLESFVWIFLGIWRNFGKKSKEYFPRFYYQS